jgi:aldose 1-epimerase
MSMIQEKEFGTLPSGEPVKLHVLRQQSGAELQITNYGATIVRLLVPGKAGQLGDVVLGYDTLAGYLDEKNRFYGATIGRYGNRICQGRFRIGDQLFSLAINNGPNALHGGLAGFDKRLWTVTRKSEEPDGSLLLEQRYTSADGEEGYPGKLEVSVTYRFTPSHAVAISYEAKTDKATIVNLTNHSYFNLAGHGDILQHKLQLEADTYLPVTENLIPLGELRPVLGTPFDFTQARAIGARIHENSDPQIKLADSGYDHNFVLRGWQPAGALRRVGAVEDGGSGRRMEVWTTEPGVQLFTCNKTTYEVAGNPRAASRSPATCFRSAACC